MYRNVGNFLYILLKTFALLLQCIVLQCKVENFSHIYVPLRQIGVRTMIDKIKSDSMDLLFNAILTLESVDDCYKFFDDLCTSIELKSFAQRLHVAKLLDEHRVYNSIVTETGASTATISRVNRSLKDGNDGYNIVFDRLKKNGLLK